VDPQLGTNLIQFIVFGVAGVILLYLSYRVLDWLTPTDLGKDIFENGNVAAAVFAGAFILAIAIIIGAAII
jgi:putative membrane protein